MNPLHAGLFFVLLLLPNTTLRDWQSANAPHLHQIMATGSFALMNARTAEDDQITPSGGINTLMAGARMKADGNDKGLDYRARSDNLPAALEDAGVYNLSPPLFPAQTLTPRPSLDGPPAPNNGGVGGANSPGSFSEPGYQINIGFPASEGMFWVANFGSDPAKADEAIGKWASIVKQMGGELMVVSPNPTPAEYDAQDQLTPVVLWGPNIPTGVLISPSTHMPGLVTNTDIAPTIADYFHAKLLIPAFGFALTTKAAANAPATLAQRDRIWQSQSVQQQAVPYIAGFMALLVAFAIAYGWKTGRNPGAVAIFAAALPFALLLSSAVAIFCSLLISSVGGAFVLRRWPREALLWLAGASSILVIGDALFESGRVTAHSLLGYSPMEGARYYGLGNEAMGVLVGALIVLTGALARFKKSGIWVALLWLIAGFALGWPSAGAKAGGLFVALVALAAYAWTATGQSTKRPLPWIIAIGAICLFGAMLALAGHFIGHTHIGQAVALARAQGMDAVRSLAVRKVSMDLHLVFHSAWVQVLLVALTGAVLSFRKRKLGRGEERIAAVTGFAATAACLALNDAGVVAAALCSVYLWAFCAVSPALESEDSAAQEAASKLAPTTD